MLLIFHNITILLYIFIFKKSALAEEASVKIFLKILTTTNLWTECIPVNTDFLKFVY